MNGLLGSDHSWSGTFALMSVFSHVVRMQGGRLQIWRKVNENPRRASMQTCSFYALGNTSRLISIREYQFLRMDLILAIPDDVATLITFDCI